MSAIRRAHAMSLEAGTVGQEGFTAAQGPWASAVSVKSPAGSLYSRRLVNGGE